LARAAETFQNNVHRTVDSLTQTLFHQTTGLSK
jgi:hypothetical protein